MHNLKTKIMIKALCSNNIKRENSENSTDMKLDKKKQV